MKIKTKLYLSMLVSVALVSIFIITRIIAFNSIEKETERLKLGTEVNIAVLELNLLLHDYLLGRQERAVKQWELRYNSGLITLQKSEEEEEEEEEEERKLIDNMTDNYLSISRLFREEVDDYNYAQKLLKEGASEKELSLVRELEERRIFQLLIQARTIISSAKRLHDIAFGRLERMYAFTRNSAYLFSMLMLIIIIAVSYKVLRDISTSLHRLHRGTEIIGKGDLDYRIDIKGKDEIAQVSRAFNRMAENLNKITASRDLLDKEITERKKIEHALRESEAWLAAVLKSVGDGMIVTDAQGCAVSLNPVAQVLTGWKQEDAKGRHLEDIFNIVNEETGKRVENPVAKVIREGTVVGLGNHTILITKDGFRRPIDDSAAPIKDADGDFIGVVLVFRDVTERRKAEEALKKANEQLKKLEQLKSDFVSTVSHELRTPLSITKEGIALVFDETTGPINPQQKKMLQTAKNNIDRLSNIINDLLDISKIEAGSMELKRGLVDIKGLVDEVVLNFRPQAKEKGLELTAILPKDSVDLYVDSGKIIQIFTNLVDDALKFTEKGAIEIFLYDKGDMVECSVADTGIGIKAEDIPKVFGKFQQFGRVSGPGGKGTGLGLAIVKELVELHHGKIWVESQPQKGTRFTFTLPKEKEDA